MKHQQLRRGYPGEAMFKNYLFTTDGLVSKREGTKRSFIPDSPGKRRRRERWAKMRQGFWYLKIPKEIIDSLRPQNGKHKVICSRPGDVMKAITPGGVVTLDELGNRMIVAFDELNRKSLARSMGVDVDEEIARSIAGRKRFTDMSITFPVAIVKGNPS